MTSKWIFALTTLLASLGAVAAEPLRVSAIPDEAPPNCSASLPLGDYLAEKTGREVVFVPVNDYAAVVEALAAGKLDMAWLWGFTYVQAHRRADKVVPLVQRQEDAQFTSKFIANVDSGIKTLADTKGKDFAFSSPPPPQVT